MTDTVVTTSSSESVKNIPTGFRSRFSLTVTNVFFFLYIAILLISAFYGFCNGMNGFGEWYKSRELVEVQFESLDSVINLLVDIGYFLKFVFFETMLSTLVAATAPVSVPMIVYLFPK